MVIRYCLCISFEESPLCVQTFTKKKMSNPRFNHIVVTRFNLPIYDKLRNGSRVRGIEEDYLEHRFEIFEKYCFASICNQTCKDFKWIVLFSDKTPKRFKQRNLELQQKCPVYFPFYFDEEKYETHHNHEAESIEFYNQSSDSDGPLDLDNEKKQFPVIHQFIRDCIIEVCNKPVDYYVTTRIDNDDAFHPAMIETIQKNIVFNNLRTPVIYNYLWGTQVWINKKIGQTIYSPNNHFCTCVERGDSQFHSVYYWPHNQLDKYLPIINIKDKPLWIEFIHDNNVGNSYICSWHSSALFSSKSLYKSFMIDIDINWMKQILFLLSYKNFTRWCKYFNNCIKNVITR